MKSQTRVHALFQTLWNKKLNNQCQYVDADGERCKTSAIKSHTVQRGRVLASIAEDGHVFEIGIPKKQSSSKERTFQKVGVNRASVFPGFCNYHDTILFSSSETGQGTLSSYEMALLGYRSICHETFKKERAERVYSNRQFLSAIASVDLAAKRSAEAHLEGTRLAIRDLTRQKQAFENAIHTKDLSRLYGTVFTLAAEIPLAFSSSFAPEYTIDGELLLPEQYGNWNSVGVFCGAIKERNIMGFVGLHDNDEHDISKFFKSLVSVPMNRVGGLSLHLAIEHAENTFFRPSWVSKLLPEIREELLSRFASGIPGEPNSRKANLVGQFDVINVSASQRDDFYP